MSDDYLFDDDIVLDEHALAILDAEESKYAGSVATLQSNPPPRHTPTRPVPPPAKRRRTDDGGGWEHPSNTPVVVVAVAGSSKLVSQTLKRSDSFYEGLPNISLAGDGVYDVYSQGSQLPQNSDAKNVGNPSGQRSQPAPAPSPNERTSSSVQNRPPQRPALQRTLTPPSNVHPNPNNSNRPQPQQQPKQQQQTRGLLPGSGSLPPQQNRAQNVGLGRNVNLPRQHEARQSVQSRPPNVASGASDRGLQEEVGRLRAQLELVRRPVITTFRIYPSTPFTNVDEHPAGIDAEGFQGGTGRKVPKSG